MTQPVIVVAGVTKTYVQGGMRARSFRESLVQLLRPQEAGPPGFTALSNIDFVVDAGETVGIVGRNGSGKSTLLKLLTGIIQADCGDIVVRGRVSPLLELGAGFHPEFSGRENVFLNGVLLGLLPAEIRALFDRIVDFSEIRDFIDRPVKTYSSGMYTRLAFAVAVHAKPEILLIDEVLAVGDAAFQAKCLARIQELKRSGTTIVFVSHDAATVRSICKRVLWIDGGVLRMDGEADAVLAAYAEMQRQRQQGPCDVRVSGLAALSRSGQALETVRADEPFTLAFDWATDADLFVAWQMEIRRGPAGGLLGALRAEGALLSGGTAGQVRLDVSASGLSPGPYQFQVVGIGQGDTPVAGASCAMTLTVEGAVKDPQAWVLPGSW